MRQRRAPWQSIQGGSPRASRRPVEDPKPMTFAEYVVAVAVRQGLIPSWRYGQTCFNVLAEHRPDLSEEIRSTEIDPFYRDDLVPYFLAVVAERW